MVRAINFLCSDWIRFIDCFVTVTNCKATILVSIVTWELCITYHCHKIIATVALAGYLLVIVCLNTCHCYLIIVTSVICQCCHISIVNASKILSSHAICAARCLLGTVTLYFSMSLQNFSFKTVANGHCHLRTVILKFRCSMPYFTEITNFCTFHCDLRTDLA